MHYIIYMDVLFVVNYIMDYIVLAVTIGILIHTTTIKRPDGKKQMCFMYIRRALASAFGAVWACFLLGLGFNGFLWNLVTYLVVGPLMIGIVIGKEKPLSYLKSIGVMYIVTFVISGGIHILYYYTSLGYFIHVFTKNGRDGFRVWMLFTSVFVVGMFFEWFVFFCGKIQRKHEDIYTVVLVTEAGRIKLKGLCDTGNNLKDPFYNEPVNVVPSGLVSKLIKGNTTCHLIPFSSIGNENGVIPVVRINELRIIGKNESIKVNKPLIALYSGNFAKSTNYEFIIHPDVMKKTKG